MSQHSKPPLLPGLSPKKKLAYAVLTGLTLIAVAVAIIIKVSDNSSSTPTTISSVEQQLEEQKAATPVEQTDDKPLEIGQQAPNWVLEEVAPGAGKISLNNYRGKPVLLEFIATWCPHCQAMAPVIAKAVPNSGVEYVMIGADGETDQEVAKFHRNFKAPGIAVNGTPEVIDDYKLAGYPMLVFINSNGKINYLYAGEMRLESLNKQLRELK